MNVNEIHQTDIFYAVADANRRKLLDLLIKGEQPVQGLAAHFDISLQAVSQHLQILANAGLVSKRKQGRFRYYRAEPAALQTVHDWVSRYRLFWDARLDRLGQVLDERQ